MNPPHDTLRLGLDSYSTDFLLFDPPNNNTHMNDVGPTEHYIPTNPPASITLSPPQVVVSEGQGLEPTIILSTEDMNFPDLGLDGTTGGLVAGDGIGDLDFGLQDYTAWRDVNNGAGHIEDDRSSVFSQGSDHSDAVSVHSTHSLFDYAPNAAGGNMGGGPELGGFLAPPNPAYLGGRRTSTTSLLGFEELNIHDDGSSVASDDYGMALLSTSAPASTNGFLNMPDSNIIRLTSPMIRAIPSPNVSPLLTPHSPDMGLSDLSPSLDPQQSFGDDEGQDIDSFLGAGSTESLDPTYMPPLQLDSCMFNDPNSPMSNHEKSVGQILEELNRYDAGVYQHHLNQLRQAQQEQAERNLRLHHHQLSIQAQIQQQQQQQQQQYRQQQQNHQHHLSLLSQQFNGYPSPSPDPIKPGTTPSPQPAPQPAPIKIKVEKHGGTPVPPRADMPPLPKPKELALKTARQTLYQCPFPECFKTFTRPYNLKSHYRSHTGERPFVCNYCTATFSRKHDLKRHSKLHEGLKPHICPACSKGFARSDALRRHLKSTEPNKETACAVRIKAMSAAGETFADGGAGAALALLERMCKEEDDAGAGGSGEEGGGVKMEEDSGIESSGEGFSVVG
ncbi:hypothetical protein HK104_010579 [Borealophlyctis nickersoniae]|nr:hypothetical protein HK104_010579 [Borealophlyctis nickersoniae]